jgi:hypothetical protein
MNFILASEQLLICECSKILVHLVENHDWASYVKTDIVYQRAKSPDSSVKPKFRANISSFFFSTINDIRVRFWVIFYSRTVAFKIFASSFVLTKQATVHHLRRTVHDNLSVFQKDVLITFRLGFSANLFRINVFIYAKLRATTPNNDWIREAGRCPVLTGCVTILNPKSSSSSETGVNRWIRSWKSTYLIELDV